MLLCLCITLFCSFVTLSLSYSVLHYPVFCSSTLSLYYPIFVLLLLCLYLILSCIILSSVLLLCLCITLFCSFFTLSLSYSVLHYPVFCSSTLSLHYPVLFFCYFVFFLFCLTLSCLLFFCYFVFSLSCLNKKDKNLLKGSIKQTIFCIFAC